MAEASAFRGVIEFFNSIGMYDVVLPFLLVFTIVFAVLDKTRVFGSDQIGDMSYPKKNINAIVAFVIGFFVVASAQLVEVITQVSSQVVVLLMASVLFLMLIGSFMKETEEGVFLEEAWQRWFMVAMLVGVLFIFLNALNWLMPAYEWVTSNWSGETFSTLALMATVGGVMALVMSNPGRNSKKKKDKDDED